jgi:hypothetical protein
MDTNGEHKKLTKTTKNDIVSMYIIVSEHEPMREIDLPYFPNDELKPHMIFTSLKPLQRSRTHSTQ